MAVFADFAGYRVDNEAALGVERNGWTLHCRDLEPDSVGRWWEQWRVYGVLLLVDGAFLMAVEARAVVWNVMR